MADQTDRDKKLNEVLKPYYAQIQDRNGRLPAMRACHSDRDRAALADGIRSQAINWATESLRAVLQECKDITPPELASHSDRINEIVTYLARDAAEFYSISSEDTAESLDEDAKFPDHRSEIREQLQGVLAKFTESYWGENQKYHLVVAPPPPNVVKADEPLVRRDGTQGAPAQFPVAEAEFKIEDEEALTEAVRQTGWSTESDSPVTVPQESITKAVKGGPPELPLKVQNMSWGDEESQPQEGGEMDKWRRMPASFSIATKLAELAGKDESMLGKVLRGELKDILLPLYMDRPELENPLLREWESALNDQQIDLESPFKTTAPVTPKSDVCPLPPVCAKYDLELSPLGRAVAETAEQAALRKNIEDAVALLQLSPSFPSVMIRIQERQEHAARDLPREANAWLSPARMEYAIARLDIQAEELISLVLDIPTQNAFAVLLDTIVMPQAWGGCWVPKHPSLRRAIARQDGCSSR